MDERLYEEKKTADSEELWQYRRNVFGEGNAELIRVLGKIAWGYVLIYVNINLGLSGITLDLLPGWLGYLLMFSALPLMRSWAPSAMLLRPFAIALVLDDLISPLLDLFEIGYIISIIMGIVGIYFHFQLLTDLSAAAEGERKTKILQLRTANTLFQAFFSLVSIFFLGMGESEALILIVPVIFALILVIWTIAVLFSWRGELRRQIDRELQKGMDSMSGGKRYTADEVDKEFEDL